MSLFLLNICVLMGFFVFGQPTMGEVSPSGTTTTRSNYFYFLHHHSKYPRDCSEIHDQCNGINSSGVFIISPDGYYHPFEVYCNNNFDNGGWTVLHRRLDGSLFFNRGWTAYRDGFGYFRGEFWLGNEKISFLTNQRKYELRIDMITSNGSKAFMTFNNFRLSDEWRNYSLASAGVAAGNAHFLAPKCPLNMVYAFCTCQKTCETPMVCQNVCHGGRTCICPEGFYLKGNDCVPPEGCDCYFTSAGRIISTGDFYIDNGCSLNCSCNGSALSCTSYVCNSDATCTSTNEGGRCMCNTGYVGDGLDCRCNTGYMDDGASCRRPKDCDEVPLVEGYHGGGVYYILPSNWQEFEVYCNMSEGSWTVFQRRIIGTGRNFYMYWNDYKRGFGELEKDFWLGNDKIHFITWQNDYQLRIDIIDSANGHYRAYYDGFRIANEENKYRITKLGTYSGNTGYDAMRAHLNQPFSTRDRDNDDWHSYCEFDVNHNVCAYWHRGGWWYKYRQSSSSTCDRFYQRYCYSYNTYYPSCAFAHLNGKKNGQQGQTITWHGLSGNDCGIEYIEMKIRSLP